MAMPTPTCSQFFISFALTFSVLSAAEGDPAGDIGGTAPHPAPAATAPAEAPVEGSDSAARMANGQANTMVREGMDLVRQFNDNKAQNPNAVVDAAICFGKARKLLVASGSVEDISAVQSNLYWCKKQMDMDALKDYVARKGEDGKLAMAQLEAVSSVMPDAKEAPTYLARAEKFASANPDNHLQIAIRFLEVAERFPGEASGTEANKRALAAQQAMIKAAQDAAEAARATRFTKPGSTKPGETPLPSASAQKDALAAVKQSYAKSYAKKDPASKRKLSRKLLAESGKNKNDPAIYQQMLSESIRLAIESEDYEPLLDAVDQMALTYTGYDAIAEKKAALKKMSGKATATAIAKLLDTPGDPAANLAAGRWFAFTARRWTEGFPLLARGGDPAIAKVAQMEIDHPTNAQEQMQVADAWFDVGKSAKSKEDKTGCMARSMTWYQGVVGGLEGISKDRVAKRIVEIDKLLPLDPDSVDWEALTASQWDKLKGKIVVIPARTDRTDSGVALAAGERIRVVPQPTDQWTFDLSSWYSDGGKKSFGWKGYVRTYTYTTNGTTMTSSYMYSSGGSNMGALMAWVDNGEKKNCGIMVGPGRLYFSPQLTYYGTSDRSGQLRAKLLPVDDDE